MNYRGHPAYSRDGSLNYGGRARYNSGARLDYTDQSRYNQSVELDYRDESRYNHSAEMDYGDQSRYNHSTEMDYRDDSRYNHSAEMDYRDQSRYNQSAEMDYRDQSRYNQSPEMDYRDQSRYNQSPEMDYRDQARYSQSPEMGYRDQARYSQSLEMGYRDQSRYNQSPEIDCRDQSGYNHRAEMEYRDHSDYNQSAEMDYRDIARSNGDYGKSGGKEARTVVCRTLSDRVRKYHFEDFFGSVGMVTDVYIIRKRGFDGLAYVEFMTAAQAEAAISLSGRRLLGVPVNIQRPQPGQIESSGPVKLFVGSLHTSITEEIIRTIFHPFGGIDDIQLERDVNTQQSKGCGFVVFQNAAAAGMARTHLNGLAVAGKKMEVRLWHEKELSRLEDSATAVSTRGGGGGGGDDSSIKDSSYREKKEPSKPLTEKEKYIKTVVREIKLKRDLLNQMKEEKYRILTKTVAEDNEPVAETNSNAASAYSGSSYTLRVQEADRWGSSNTTSRPTGHSITSESQATSSSHLMQGNVLAAQTPYVSHYTYASMDVPQARMLLPQTEVLAPGAQPPSQHGQSEIPNWTTAQESTADPSPENGLSVNWTPDDQILTHLSLIQQWPQLLPDKTTIMCRHAVPEQDCNSIFLPPHIQDKLETVITRKSNLWSDLLALHTLIKQISQVNLHTLQEIGSRKYLQDPNSNLVRANSLLQNAGYHVIPVDDLKKIVQFLWDTQYMLNWFSRNMGEIRRKQYIHLASEDYKSLLKSQEMTHKWLFDSDGDLKVRIHKNRNSYDNVQ